MQEREKVVTDRTKPLEGGGTTKVYLIWAVVT